MLNNAIKSWPIDDRPIEKLANKGVKELSNTELLAILINSGTPTKSAIEIARELLSTCNNSLLELGTKSLNQIKSTKGIGNVKASRILAALELGNRRIGNFSSSTNKVKVKSSKDIYNYLRGNIISLQIETVGVLYFNTQNHIIANKKISEGGINSCIVDIRVILKYAFENNAISLVLYHNHPSGVSSPSNADNLVTENLMHACTQCNIKLLDHLIVTPTEYYSFADNNLIL